MQHTGELPVKYAIEARGLSKHFGSLSAVRDVSIRAQQDRLHAVIGPNGAGKSTLFNLLSGILTPSAGEVLLNGEDITGIPLRDLVARGVGRAFQTTSLFPDLTVYENIRLAAYVRTKHTLRDRLHKASKIPVDRRIVQEVMDRFNLGDHAEVPVTSLSHAGRRKVELALLTAQDPKVLLLDEPTAGLAAEEIPTLLEMINSFRSEGRTVILVEHNMEVVMRLADTITVMSQGSVLAEGSPSEIASNSEVQDIYLGRRSKGGAR